MKLFPVILALTILTGHSSAQTPGGKSLAELVRERFEENPSEEPSHTPPPNKESEPSSGTTPPVSTPEPVPTPVPEPEPEPEPAVDVTSIPLPDFAPESEAYAIKSGDTLERISRSHYGAGTFAPILQSYNKVDPRRLRIGQKLKTPPLATYLREMAPGAVIHYPEEMGALLELIEEFTKLRTAIGTETPTEEHKAALTALQQKVTKTREGLSSDKDGISRKPTKTLSQLKTFDRYLGQTAAGKEGTPARNLVSAHTHLVLAFNEAITWGKRIKP